MSSTYVRSLPVARTRRNRRAQAISLLGPMTVAAGLVWAIVQPYRLTLLHPHGQGFWWLVVEPPLLVVVAGLFFALVVARPLLTDLEEFEASPRAIDARAGGCKPARHRRTSPTRRNA